VVSIEVPAPDQPVKLHEIHLTAYPDRGVKVFEHPGCSQWETPLDGKPLLPVGVSGPCPTCGDKNVPLTVSEPNGYDPATYKPPAAAPIVNPGSSRNQSRRQRHPRRSPHRTAVVATGVFAGAFSYRIATAAERAAGGAFSAGFVFGAGDALIAVFVDRALDRGSRR
jgi:hypothetical protein